MFIVQVSYARWTWSKLTEVWITEWWGNPDAVFLKIILWPHLSFFLLNKSFSISSSQKLQSYFKRFTFLSTHQQWIINTMALENLDDKISIVYCCIQVVLVSICSWAVGQFGFLVHFSNLRSSSIETINCISFWYCLYRDANPRQLRRKQPLSTAERDKQVCSHDQSKGLSQGRHTNKKVLIKFFFSNQTNKQTFDSYVLR